MVSEVYVVTCIDYESNPLCRVYVDQERAEYFANQCNVYQQTAPIYPSSIDVEHLESDEADSEYDRLFDVFIKAAELWRNDHPAGYKLADWSSSCKFIVTPTPFDSIGDQNREWVDRIYYANIAMNSEAIGDVVHEIAKAGHAQQSRLQQGIE